MVKCLNLQKKIISRIANRSLLSVLQLNNIQYYFKHGIPSHSDPRTILSFIGAPSWAGKHAKSYMHVAALDKVNTVVKENKNTFRVSIINKPWTVPVKIDINFHCSCKEVQRKIKIIFRF